MRLLIQMRKARPQGQNITCSSIYSLLDGNLHVCRPYIFTGFELGQELYSKLLAALAYSYFPLLYFHPPSFLPNEQLAIAIGVAMVSIFTYLHLFFPQQPALTHINSFEPIEPILLQFAETLHIGIEMATKATKNVEKAKLEEVKEVAVRGLPPEGLSMASGDGYGAKNLQSKS